MTKTAEPKAAQRPETPASGSILPGSPEATPSAGAPAVTKSKRFRFRIADGRHIEQYETGERKQTFDDIGNPIGRPLKVVTEKFYFTGDVIETDLNLHKMYDQPGLPPKFVPVEGPKTLDEIDADIARLQQLREEQIRGGPATQEGGPNIRPGDPGTIESVISNVSGFDSLKVMDEKELRKAAAEADVDLRGAKDRDEIIKRILASRQV